jgi:ketosteroid isomerase-like protein
LRCDGTLLHEVVNNEDLVRDHFDAMNDGDAAAFAARLHPDVVVRAGISVLGRFPRELKGVDSVLEGFRSLRGHYDRVAYAIRNVVDHGDGRVFCDGGFTVTSGSVVETRTIFWAIRVREGRIVLLAGCERAEDAWRALDLPAPSDTM